MVQKHAVKGLGPRLRVGWLLLAAGALLCVATGAALRGFRRSESAPALGVVSRGDLTFSIIVSGELESQQCTDIDCQVYNFGNVNSVRILKLVPNGATVRQGQLLAQLDSAPVRERLERYEDLIPYYEARQLQADARLENQKTANETTLANAKLAVRLAELSLRQYADEQDGVCAIDLRNARLKTGEALVNAQLYDSREAAARALYRIGYRSRYDLKQAVYQSLQAEVQLVRAIMACERLQRFNQPHKMLQLQSSLRTARQRLKQVQLDNQSRLIQREADKFEADVRLERYGKLVDRYRQQVENFEIFAPHDGVVEYVPSESTHALIAEGAPAAYRQTLMRLVNSSFVQVDVPLHELEVRRVRPGLSASVRVLAFPDRAFRGTVREVAPMPDTWGYLSGVNAYSTIVAVDQPVEDLRPGMTCVVEIDVGTQRDVVRAPVESIRSLNDRNYVYVVGPQGPERRPVALGETTDRFVAIRQGLRPGEQVALDPASLEEQASPESWPF